VCHYSCGYVPHHLQLPQVTLGAHTHQLAKGSSTAHINRVPLTGLLGLDHLLLHWMLLLLWLLLGALLLLLLLLLQVQL
jgi:hypothetical protein